MKEGTILTEAGRYRKPESYTFIKGTDETLAITNDQGSVAITHAPTGIEVVPLGIESDRKAGLKLAEFGTRLGAAFWRLLTENERKGMVAADSEDDVLVWLPQNVQHWLYYCVEKKTVKRYVEPDYRSIRTL